MQPTKLLENKMSACKGSEFTSCRPPAGVAQPVCAIQDA